MKILVCLKQVPDTTEVRLNEDLTLERDFIAQVMNPADESALELGLRLRDENGGSLTALSMGPERAQGMLREALSRGADHAALMTAPAFAGADTLVTAKCLRAAVRFLGGFDLILCGRRAVDGETGQVGPMLASLLDIPCAANVTGVTVTEGRFSAAQLTEAGTLTWQADLPAVITLCEWSYRLRLPTIRGLKAAAAAQIARLTPEGLGLSPAQCGLKASPTRVTRISARPSGVRPCVKAPLQEVLERLEKRDWQHGAAEDKRFKAAEASPSGAPAMTVAVLCEGEGLAAGELLAKARGLAPNGNVIALYESAQTALDRLAAYGADQALGLGISPDDGAQGCVIAEALAALKPDAALFPATVRGRFLSAWVAARLDTGLTADCTELCLTPEGLLKQVRPAFGGNLTAEILCRERRPQMASVRPGVFPTPAPVPGGRVTALTPVLTKPKPFLTPAGFQPAEQGVSIVKAPVVVAGGKGVGSQKGFDKLFELAGLLGGGVGATRSAVDAGWVGYAHQVGQTGVTVRPKLYIAFGVSGLVQHTVGMNGSGTVVAVNKDRNAPIFACADYGVVADWETTIDEWIQYLKERKIRS